MVGLVVVRFVDDVVGLIVALKLKVGLKKSVMDFCLRTKGISAVDVASSGWDVVVFLYVGSKRVSPVCCVTLALMSRSLRFLGRL